MKDLRDLKDLTIHLQAFCDLGLGFDLGVEHVGHGPVEHRTVHHVRVRDHRV